MKIDFEKDERRILSQVPPDYYQKGYKNSFLQRKWHNGKLKVIIDLIPDSPGSILDVGSASGWFLSNIKKKFPKSKCVGVDKYKEAIIFGNKKYKNLNLVFGDAQNLPFKDNSFDLVICAEVLEHVNNPSKVLSEIYRVLTPGGLAVIEMDSGNILFKSAWFWWTNIRHGVWEHSHIHSFNTNKLERMIRKSHLKIEKKKIFNFTMAVAFLLKKE